MKNLKVQLDHKNYNQYHILVSINKELVIALIDTGSSTSFISKDLAKEIFDLYPEITYISLEGSSIQNTKYTSINIIFSKILSVEIEIPIDGRIKQEKKEIILGIDFLENFDYKITSKELILKIEDEEFVIPRINLYKENIKRYIL